MVVGPKTYFKSGTFVNGKFGNVDPPIVSSLIGPRTAYFSGKRKVFKMFAYSLPLLKMPCNKPQDFYPEPGK